MGRPQIQYLKQVARNTGVKHQTDQKRVCCRVRVGGEEGRNFFCLGPVGLCEGIEGGITV